MYRLSTICRLLVFSAMAAPMVAEEAIASSPGAVDSNGFISLFDGQTLTGWRGESTYWSVQNGAIVGEVTEQTLLDKNRFLICQRDLPGDFELKAEYRISALGNSGVNYRSEQVDGVSFLALAGYQCDLDGRLRYTGSNYEERGRTTLARVGESVVIPAADSSGDPGRAVANAWSLRKIREKLRLPEDLRTHIPADSWNRVRILALGPVMEHYVNGVLMSRVVDNDVARRRLKGKLGVQVHVGPPMTIEYRSVRFRPLAPSNK